MNYRDKSCLVWVAIAALGLAISCMSCAKAELLPQPKRVYILSERYTNPPEWLNDTTWRPYKIVKVALSEGVSFSSYKNLKPDTIYSTCSIDKIDSAFKIEIRKFINE